MNENEEIFRKISDAANDAIITADSEGNITYWNNATVKMFGYSAEETVGKTLHRKIIPERFRDAHLNGFKKFCSTGQGAIIGKTVELAAIRKDGTEFPIELSLSGVKIKGKWNAIGIIRDITERKIVEEKISEVAKRYHDLFEYGNDAIFIADSKIQNILDVNKKAEELLGYTRDEMLQKKLLDIRPKSDQKHFKKRLRNLK